MVKKICLKANLLKRKKGGRGHWKLFTLLKEKIQNT
jgi:hypothetical protein